MFDRTANFKKKLLCRRCCTNFETSKKTRRLTRVEGNTWTRREGTPDEQRWRKIRKKEENFYRKQPNDFSFEAGKIIRFFFGHLTFSFAFWFRTITCPFPGGQNAKCDHNHAINVSFFFFQDDIAICCPQHEKQKRGKNSREAKKFFFSPFLLLFYLQLFTSASRYFFVFCPLFFFLSFFLLGARLL